VLDAGGLGDDVPRSELERRFLVLCRRAALPSPAVNAWLAVAGEEMQVDFVWHGSRSIVEVDGFRTHGTRRAFREDRRRDRLLELAGWRVVRFTWDDVTGDPDHVTSVLRELALTASRGADATDERVASK
jgi:very-short-patch-repair endonuclease